MTRPLPRLAILSALTVLALAGSWASSEAADRGPVSFLTGPQAGVPYDLALAFVASYRQQLGLEAADLEDMVVRDHYRTRHNGVTHVYLQQRLDGVEVAGGVMNVNVARDGSIINLGSDFVVDLAGKVGNRSPLISDRSAIERAAVHYDLSLEAALDLVSAEGGPDLRVTFSPAGISRDEIPVRLVYQQQRDGRVRLAWETVLSLIDSTDWWTVWIDAANGEILGENNLTRSDSYLAIPFPVFANPEESGGQIVVVDPADATASPFGWHDTNGAAGAEFTHTEGNNVDAHDDLDGDNGVITPGIRPDGGASLDFSEVWDENLSPTGGTNLEAGIVNLFYMNNVMHDITYQYGFDELSGNFQTNNYGNGGLQTDEVEADALDGSGLNNATFGTPSDGLSPRMTMFRFTQPFDSLTTVLSPGTIAGDYDGSLSGFGPALSAVGLTADFELANDGGGAGTPSDACEPLIGFTNGNIAMIDRGGCNFDNKIANAETAGAIGAIIVNDRPGLLSAGGDGVPPVNIPSMMLTQTDGATIKAELGGGVNGTIKSNPTPTIQDRDSSFDNAVVAHEYGHGVSNRLTGGPGNSNCLPMIGNPDTSEQAGEGWSDFWSLLLTADAADQPTDARGIGGYINFDSILPGTNGIRNFPYSTDEVVNPQTYANIGATNVPHGVGEIWMSMLWEVYWELVVKHGFDADFYTGTGGNNLTMQLMVDGLKLQPCFPDFVEARDAILLADQTNNSGANQCEIWRGFAKRGLGVSAFPGDPAGAPVVGNETEAFDLPPDCPAGFGALFADGFESGNTSVWSSTTP